MSAANLKYTGHNAQLAYSLSGTHVADMRCSQLVESYGVNSDESHARRNRAFYPHRRVQGTFAMRFDFAGWAEYERAMTWFHDYADALLGARNPSPMLVRCDARNFVRLGVPTTGPEFGDHVGSMLFQPTITFVSVWDPRDPNTSIINAVDASQALPVHSSLEAEWFYPDSTLNRPGALQQYIYDKSSEAAASKAATIQQLLSGGPEKVE